MPFQLTDEQLERLLPPYLTKAEKGRLKYALKQFQIYSTDKSGLWSEKYLSRFYLQKKGDYFLQADLVRDIRQPVWIPDLNVFKTKYADALILSNTCDLDLTNKRIITKETVFAPLIGFDVFVEELKFTTENDAQLRSIVQGVKMQIYSNVFYLPPLSNASQGYVCFFDNVFWFPTERLNTYLSSLEQTRIQSLDYFGYYLFLVKLSYHFCRLPEDRQR